MWICSRCQTKNREGDTRCIQCSAPRSARRFGAGTAVETPSVSGAAAREIRSPQVYAAPKPQEGKAGARLVLEQTTAAAQAEGLQLGSPRARRPGSAAARLLSASGLILAIMLPALFILLSILHWGELSPQVERLFFPGPAADMAAKGAAAVPAVLGFFIYALLTALAALLCLLPGLTALGLGQLLTSLTRAQGRFY